ncbi:hypothetical protein BABINDRAFT_163887 [Babjeviella inositovora NRRL Y-12698]|uniref:Sugar phosphate phosphatase n=1 Tax=Babjeviella inositovora NRRL Y-12698 TaxID=984486 RepID=A0A1E3QH20_9ASCO|nr:uncharacterized protein BABINDRAFT_163887 [Babjeviella inositovora NRRL Y-12698]ODQ76981.1 hypothetical protein BABINDRAFT_163887 [Babjeviella inositovora NRRL Y-12698]
MTLPSVYYNNDPTSFAFSTCQKRWPTIVENMVNDIRQALVENCSSQDFLTQGETIFARLSQLLLDIRFDHAILPFEEPSVPGLASYDERIAKLETPPTWLTAPWLFSECYLYRRAHIAFVQQPLWKDYDVFNRLKQETFKSSEAGVVELAVRYQQLHAELQHEVSVESLKLLFREFADISLWGNATDLSLLANATLEDIKSVQGAEARKNSEKNILANDLDAAWDQLYNKAQDKAHRRVDIVLDNSGFEFYADLIFTLFLLDSKLVSKVVLHCKTIPWMVSDTMIKDYQITIDDLNSKEFFPTGREPLEFLARQLEQYKASGALELQDHEFWAAELDYWHIKPSETKYGGAEVHRELAKSDLVIFKGDLNYRKLTGDRKWPRDTPFITGIGDLASSGLKIWSLRTCKADVCCGLEKGKDEELSQIWRDQGNKVGELWCSSGKWAVMSFSNGQN